MDKILHVNINDITPKHKNEHEKYEYHRRILVPMGENQCFVSVYEIPPGKTAYPYHYHLKNEESFYIISGKGLLKTPSGEKEVKAGDFLFFPTGEAGTHMLINSSENDFLIYLDYDTYNDLDVAVYPNSEKIGIWGKGINKVYSIDDNKDYYEGE